MKYGIDVSQFNGEIDWKRVKESGRADFAIIRSGLGWTDGDVTFRRDARFLENVAGCEENGIPYGLYHYSYCLRPENAVKEAEYAARNIAGTRPALGVWYDMEDSGQIPLGREALTRMARTFLDTLKEAGFEPGIYSYLNWMRQYLDLDALDGAPLWLAQVDVPAPTLARPVRMWQYSWKGRVDGISGDVDLDRLEVPEAEAPGDIRATLDGLLRGVAEQLLSAAEHLRSV